MSDGPGREARMWEGDRGRPRRDGRRGRGRGEQTVVPDATFSSYYGRAVIKRPVWEEQDIAGYLFAGGLAAGSAILGAGGDLTGRPALRRCGRLTAMGALGWSAYALIHDLGRRDRFYNMLRVFKPTSPMSVGSWLLAAFSVPAGLAAAAELPGVVPAPLRPLVRWAARPAGIASAGIAPAVATYTAVLLADTAVPSWHAVHPELPFVFAGSALSAAAGVGLLAAPCPQSGPARRLAALGAALELAASQRLEHRLGLLAAPYKQGKAGRKMRLAELMTLAGAVGAVGLASRHRALAAGCGAALVTASALTRFAIFEAGVASAEDPKYVVLPQRERLNGGAAGDR